MDQSPEHYSQIFKLAKVERFRQRDRDKEIVEKLARMDPLEYDQARGQFAAELKVRVSVLDALITKARAQQAASKNEAHFTFEITEPWPEPVSGDSLADDIARTLKSFIIMPDEAIAALSLWIIHTFCFSN